MDFVLKAGKYWVGDPVYGLDNSSFRLISKKSSYPIEMFSTIINGEKIITIMLHYENEILYSSDYDEIEIDTGLVCIIPESLVFDNIKLQYGLDFELEEETSVEYDGDEIKIGNTIIFSESEEIDE